MSQAEAIIGRVRIAIHPKRQVPQDRKEVLHTEGFNRTARLVASRPFCEDASLQVRGVRNVAHWQ